MGWIWSNEMLHFFVHFFKFILYRRRQGLRTRNGSYGEVHQGIWGWNGRASKGIIAVEVRHWKGPILLQMLTQLLWLLWSELPLKISGSWGKNGPQSGSKPHSVASWYGGFFLLRFFPFLVCLVAEKMWENRKTLNFQSEESINFISLLWVSFLFIGTWT